MNRRLFNSIIASFGACSLACLDASRRVKAAPFLTSGAAPRGTLPIDQTGAEQPTVHSRASWYKPPQLFVMIGFIANTTSGTWGADFIVAGPWSHEKQQSALAAWKRDLGLDYDAEKVIAAFQDAGASGVIFYDKWHDGLVNHPTHLTNFHTDRDLLGETLRALRHHNMKAVVYYSVGLDYNPDPRFLEWACRDSNGRPMGMAFPTDWKSFHSPYRQYVIGQLVEILKSYGPIDGFWFNVFDQPTLSYDHYTRAAFLSRFHKEVEEATNQEAEDFVVETLHNFLLEIRQAISAIEPRVSFTWNGSGVDDIVRPRKAIAVDGQCDWFSREAGKWDQIDDRSRTFESVDRPHEVSIVLNSSWYVPTADRPPPASMSSAEAIVSAATAFVQGANVYAAMTPGHSGKFDTHGDLRLLRAVGNWLKDNRPWLEETAPYADIGVVTGIPSQDLLQIPMLKDIWAASHRAIEPPANGQPGDEPTQGLRDLGYFTERTSGFFTARQFELRDYRMLLLPETALLDEGFTQQIRGYVQRGGALLAFGHASLFDQQGKLQGNFALGDVFGADFAGPLAGYKHLAHSPGSGVSSMLPLNPGALKVRARSAKVLAVWEGAGDTPAVVRTISATVVRYM